MSTLFDAAGAEEKTEKGKTPKGRISCGSPLGHAVKSCMTVIRTSDGALSRDIFAETFAGALSRRRFCASIEPGTG